VTTLNHRTLTIQDSPYTVQSSDYIVGVDTTNGAVNIDLPSASVMGPGFTFIVKDEGGRCHVANILLQAPVTQTIDNADSLVVSTAYASYQLYTNGINWFVLD
jgi:hypothetical protein